ncbi:PLP-dependent aminotransferase family protein [Chromobacterium subtsugae]|uniref:Putative 8-amino-7-oxononanoate synthase n=1 Tax=Chromobacterium subtsugae TaxID=251747 RepID=A0ABS7F7Q6_9NEIS|nr:MULTISPECIES: PLP-dependent aminotransferase family protein [Chromobacterium]KUM01840.1 transcriptional regulator [Chromobacterium subtsugae]KZE83153.1 transcriptional regulator [Chromobacterium sp. F49]MBW7567112.1 PLP-dependent aminotransferase family protein [Chromobacterium subtsugae]MBW8286082.1 PLP-dependent aminotransferase family protein [Chromobacterium subtsugae]WSE91862.1 PLP-dependent aminotransferase family protein [Chromobacterium subtsugae]
MPQYQDIARQLQTRLDAGEFPPGSRLPSVRQLAESHGVNSLTALAAYRWLEQRQRVVARPRAGFFAALPPASAAGKPDKALPSPATLVQVDSRMSQLVALSASNVAVQLHMAEAHHSLYPSAELARRLQNALQQRPELIGAYLPASQHDRLCEQLRQLAAGWQLAIPSDEILFCNGITEGISLALRHLARPGDTVAVETPVYFGLLQTLAAQGLKALEIPCTPDAGLSLEALEFALQYGPPVRCLVTVTNYQNPTGALMPDDNKKRLLALARRHGVAIIEDDVFGELHFGDARPTPLKAWDRDGDVIYCASFTKSLAPSFRLGWLSGGRHHAALERLRASSSLVSPALLLGTLSDLLASGDYARISQRLRSQLARQMEQVADAVLAAFPRGTRLRRPQGGLLLWVEGPEGLDSGRLLEAALRESISFAPGMLFSAEPRFRHCLRLNFGQPWDAAQQQAIARLGQLAAEQLRSPC